MYVRFDYRFLCNVVLKMLICREIWLLLAKMSGLIYQRWGTLEIRNSGMYVLKSKGCIMINVLRKKIKFEDIKNMYIFIYLYLFIYQF